MCGLYGFQFDLEHAPGIQERQLLSFLLGQGAEARGRHACGFAAYEHDANRVVIEKQSGTFTRSDLILAVARYTNVIGHTRYATVGSQTKENAHPFHYRHIVGAHNGGIYNYHELAKKYNKRAFEVDSQHLLAHIANGHPFEELEGYGAVTWFDTTAPGRVYLCRMRNGDLDLEELEGVGCIWASTVEILREAMSPLQWYSKSKKRSLHEGRVYYVEGGKLHETNDRIAISGGRAVRTTTEPTSKGSVTTYYGSSSGGYIPPSHNPNKNPRWSMKHAGYVDPLDDVLLGTSNWGEAQRLLTEKRTKAAKEKKAAKHAKKVKSDEIIGSVHVRRSSKSKYTRDTEDYLAALDRYYDGVSQPALTTGDELVNLLAEHWQLSKPRQELLEMVIDDLSRRRKRRYINLTKAIKGHSLQCPCSNCTKVCTLLFDLITTAQDVLIG